jgi:hypothetical protein
MVVEQGKKQIEEAELLISPSEVGPSTTGVFRPCV